MHYVKYPMQNELDQRGWVKLIVRNPMGVDIAYSCVGVKDNDMIPLSSAEITLVKNQTDGEWLSIRDELCRRIDQIADDVRISHLANGEKTVDLEYKQTEEAVKTWRAAGSPEDDVPLEISGWADINGESNEWAAQDIEQEAQQLKGLLQWVRQMRLTAKATIQACPLEMIKPTYQHWSVQLKAIKKSS